MQSAKWCRTGVLLGVLASVLQGFAQPYNPQAHVQPSSGPVGKLVTLSVSGQDPGGYTGFCIDSNYAGVNCGPGNCSTTYRMGHSIGPHVVSINCMSGPTFTVVPPTEFTISPSCIPNGGVVTLKGHHFGAAGVVSFRWDDSFIDPNKVAYTDENGDFEVSFAAPGLGEGMHTVTALGPINLTARFYSGTDCPFIGTASNVTNDVEVIHPDGTKSPLRNGDPILFDDTIKTGPGARAHINFADGTELTFSERTQVAIDSYVYNPSAPQSDGGVWSAIKGAFVWVSGAISKTPDDNVRVETLVGSIGIRGTEFISRRDPCSTTQEVYLIHGQLAITPCDTGTTNIINAPATIFFDSSTVTTSPLTQATYDSIKAEILQTNIIRAPFVDWQMDYFGCTNNSSAQAHADPDGDGQSNLDEFVAGMNPTSAASVFRITSVAREDDHLRLFWKTHGGKTNLVEAATELSGTYTNISGNIVIPGDSDTTTNFLVNGIAAVDGPQFYRIRIAP